MSVRSKHEIGNENSESQAVKEDLLEGFDFSDGLDVEGREAVVNGLGDLLWGFGPRRLEERERHDRSLSLEEEEEELTGIQQSSQFLLSHCGSIYILQHCSFNSHPLSAKQSKCTFDKW